MPRPIKIGRVYYSDIRVKGADGKAHRIRRRLSKNYQEAESKLAEMVRLRDNEKWGDPVGDLSLELFEAKYMVYSQGAKKPHTTEYDKLAFRYMREAFPITKLAQIKPEFLEQLKYRWKQMGKSDNQNNRLIHALKAAMRKAEDWKYIQPQAWSKVKPLKVTLARIKFLSIEDLSIALKKLTGDYQTVGYLGGRAGLRLGEQIALGIPDIDFRLHRLSVTAKDGWQPKDYEKRFIPMPSGLETHLRSRIKRFGRVFEHEWTVQVLSHMMSRKLKELGLDATAHTLRHSYASHLVMAGVDMKTVQELLGHASIITTENHYAHLSASHKDQAVAKLPELV